MTAPQEIWIFASYKWQGNPKALYLYMRAYHADKRCLWLAQTPAQAKQLRRQGIDAITPASPGATHALTACKVFVVENFREAYPEALNPSATVLNLWHGVGLKPVEIGVGPESDFAMRIARKYIQHFRHYRENHLFLATSEQMERRFSPEMKLTPAQILRGPYPRNQVYRDPNLRSFDLTTALGRDIDGYDTVALYAPTWRRHNISDSFAGLMPDLDTLAATLAAQNTLLIVKVHPFMEEDAAFQRAQATYAQHPNVLFWPDGYDIYEAFHKIDLAIVDYSSIYYDLLAAGVRHFIRYVPDYDSHLALEGFTDDYWALTSGAIANDFAALCDLLATPDHTAEVADSDTTDIMAYFFGHLSAAQLSQTALSGPQADLDSLIATAANHAPKRAPLKTLYSFDVFDTLVRRKCLSPVAIFHRVQELLAQNPKGFPTYLVDNYVSVRRSCERDVRAQKAQAIKETGSGPGEVTFQEIFARMQSIFQLDARQIAQLQRWELDTDATMLEPHPAHMAKLRALLDAGEDVILISDMYLPKAQIEAYLKTIDPTLGDLPLFVSSEYGHKKDTGDLFKHVFFALDYQYAQWIHFGDNKTADGAAPRALGIETLTHDMDAFSPYEAKLIQNSRNLDSYQLATRMQRYRWAMLDRSTFTFQDRRYFAYAYAGPALVFYVHWALKDALKRGYKTLYFVTRDGILLKDIADQIIAARGLSLKTKLLYGSRRVWRAMASDEEIKRDFATFYGRLGGITRFAQFAEAAGLTEDHLLATVPALRPLKDSSFSDKDVRRTASDLLLASPDYLRTLRDSEAQKRDLARRYLSQEMDLSEPFAVVEFWGRGVTQGHLADILAECAGQDVETPFYYLRSIWGDTPNCPRHRFTELAEDFHYLEPILACVPQTTVAAYEDKGPHVAPVFEPLPTTAFDDLRAGLRDFTNDHLTADYSDPARLERSAANTAYRYLKDTPHDPLICDVYAALEDNHGIYATVLPQAPKLSPWALLTTPKRRFSDLTRALPISLARSSPLARSIYRLRCPTRKLPRRRQAVFPRLPLTRYLPAQPGQILFTRRNLRLHWRPGFGKASPTGVMLPAGSAFEVKEVVWNQSGLPRIVVEISTRKGPQRGCITCHRAFISATQASLAAVAWGKCAQTLRPLAQKTATQLSTLWRKRPSWLRRNPLRAS